MNMKTSLLIGSLVLAPFVARAENELESKPVVRSHIEAKSCALDDMLDGLRRALHRGSPALRRYARELLKESTLGIAPEQLQAAFSRERDPQVIEALGASLAARTARTRDMSFIKPQLDRAVRDADPAARAAAVRSLRGIGSVEAMSETRGPGYEQLIRDASPEVRTAVVENLLSESAQVYFGHDRTVSEKAVQVASVATANDPKSAAKLLGEVSTEQVGHDTVKTLLEMFASPNAEVRAAAAHALSGVPASETASVRGVLVERYGSDREAIVRKAILEALARLGMSSAVPLLESLRSVDATMKSEIDLWLAALKSGLQEWHLVLREKQQLEQAKK